jgi:hypothetical protein
MRKTIWDSMLDADMNQRYWSHLSRRYYVRDQYSKIFLALMSSGTVASWGFWSDFAIIWKVLSAASALLAIALPLLNWPRHISSMVSLKQKWTEIKADYELLWLVLEKGKKDSEVGKELKRIKQLETKVSQQETNLPCDKKLIYQCRDEVLKSRGLN